MGCTQSHIMGSPPANVCACVCVSAPVQKCVRPCAAIPGLLIDTWKIVFKFKLVLLIYVRLTSPNEGGREGGGEGGEHSDNVTRGTHWAISPGLERTSKLAAAPFSCLTQFRFDMLTTSCLCVYTMYIILLSI